MTQTLYHYDSFQETCYVNWVIFHKAQGSIYPLQIQQHRSDHASKLGLIVDMELMVYRLHSYLVYSVNCVKRSTGELPDSKQLKRFQ